MPFLVKNRVFFTKIIDNQLKTILAWHIFAFHFKVPYWSFHEYLKGMQAFKRCPKGHIYRSTFAHCPYCDGSISGYGAESQTMLVDVEGSRAGSQEKTVLLDKVDAQVSSDSVTQEFGRENRKLAGWLVSYTMNPLGVDFRLYEGKNYIGTDANCSVCVPDESVSGMHALILFRAGKFKIRDNLSSNGTFVNDRDIEDEICSLKDGDEIQVGKTRFFFKAALPPDGCLTGNDTTL